MLPIHILFCTLSFHSINCQLQINLYLTDWVRGNENNDGLLHDCLYATSATRFDREPYQIIPYCMSEWPSTWKIQKNHIDQKFTFAQLELENITSEQLYLWSAPMDIIQRYQYYLDELPHSTTKRMLEELVYNCTLPDFGPSCEYRWFADMSHQSSLDEIVKEFYKVNPYEPTNLTCYMHMQCDRGPSPSCLDWSEICDGKIDCLDGGLDEKHCWKIEINECNEDEFRCLDGQCIPLAFLREIEFHYDCLDLSDDTSFDLMLPSLENKFSGEPTFGYEDVSCAKISNSRLKRISSSCVVKRDELLSQALFSIKPISITSDECWTAVKCIIHMPISTETFCQNLCRHGACDEIVRNTCPNIVYGTALPILLGHVFVAYRKNDLKYADANTPQPTYVCYNSTLLHLPDSNETFVRPDNMTCRFHDNSIVDDDDYKLGWIKLHIDPLYRWLQMWTSWIYNDSMACNKSTMYQCIDSNKCISKNRLLDRVQDCFHNDDENISMLNKNCSTQQIFNYFKCETTNECIPHRLVRDRICHCTMYNVKDCDDENFSNPNIRTKISFPTMCDGFTHLLPRKINDQYQTDETDCEQWPCNNIYTRCNKFWNCRNGADELNCDPSPVLPCSSESHICGSLKTNELMCLPVEKANDGIIDCIGATDEPALCRMGHQDGMYKSFHCVNDTRPSCMSWQIICDGISQCKNGDDEQICSSISQYKKANLFCYHGHTSIGSSAAKAFCTPFLAQSGDYFNTKHFKLGDVSNSFKASIVNETSDIHPHQSIVKTGYSLQRCHRGLDLQVWLDKGRNLTKMICLCPPSFYGDTCQYQNQRISITIQFLVSSDSIAIPIVVIISLIDDSDQRTIHSHEQITYLSQKYCRKKFNFYLLYSTRPKDDSKQHLIHIDIYEKKSLIYRGSTIKTILFPFLPVYRLAFQLDVPSIHDRPESCFDNQCINGKCRKYFNDPDHRTFCQCDSGWSGRYCHIPYICMCSLDSFCLGKLADNRSICVCPLNKMGSRCLLKNTFLCGNDKNKMCVNGGQCLIINEYRTIYQQVVCICPKNFTGKRCEIPQTAIIASFDRKIVLPAAIHIHFIELSISQPPGHTTSYRMIPFGQRSVTIYWPYKFHIVFIEWDQNYYLTFLQKQYNQSAIIERTIRLSDRCLNINELFNETILNFHLLRRIKYYHLACQMSSSQQIVCFHDEVHLCLCQYHQGQYVANCLEFKHDKKINCLGKSGCINGGICFQDNLKCPTTSLCVCPVCYYGAQCQLNTHGFSLSLDAILGSHIQPKYNISNQSHTVIISITVTVIVVVAGLINGLFSLITFKNRKTRQSGCAIYLLSSSIITLLTMFTFALKFSILLLSQMQSIENQLFLRLQCHSIDFFLRFFLTMNHWLTACVSIERTFIISRGISLNNKKTRLTAKWIIFSLALFVIGTTVHDPIHRSLFVENNDEQKRIWCIVEYSSAIQVFNSIMSIFHFILPFIINITAAVLIILISTRQRVNVRTQQTYKQILNEEIRRHRSLLIGPLALIILGIPHLVISFASGCMKSANDSWLFLLGYYVSLTPSLLTFVIFILPSTAYKEAFDKAISQYKNILKRRLLR